jgi:hypothetical protein
MDQALLKHLNQSINVHPYDKIVDGDKSYKAPITLAAYFEPKNQLVRNVDGEELLASGLFVVDGSHIGEIGINDLIESSYLGTHEILSIQPFPSMFDDSCDHLEVYIQ